ncbi:MAG: N-acetylmuramoyl-L-alanine amidase [Clostridiaceae bacterium]|nr:N-acetylmuramoyl-L-alanine amidase [Clostridiaceae bacterium]
MEKAIHYYNLRRFGTTIHVMEVPKDDDFVVTLCRGDAHRRQALQTIRHNWYEQQGWERIGAVNGGFFGGDRTLPYGLFYVDSGFLLSESWAGDSFLELIHQGRNFIIDDVTAAQFKAKYPKANWGVSLSYSLVINGKKDIRKGDQFPFTNQSHPRTLIGDNKDKYILVVTEGRLANEKGLTASESADLMLELGATTAINADGGGSSAMDLGGKIQNKYYANRAVADGLLVYARPNAKYKVIRGNQPTEAPTVKTDLPLTVGDPGHGGTDRANRGPSGYIEADGVLDVALEFKRLMEAEGYPVKLTREKDETVALYRRPELANLWQGDLFISFHTNAASATTAGGIETFCTLNNEWGNGDHQEAKRVAEIVQKKLVEATGWRDRGVKTRLVDNPTSPIHNKDFYAVIRRAKMPALIVEMGFHSNPQEEAKLKDPAFRKRLAKAVFDGVKEAYPVQGTSAPTPKNDGKLEVTASALNVRNDKMGVVIGQLYEKERVDKIGEHPDGDWYIVRKDTLIGFVSAAYLK